MPIFDVCHQPRAHRLVQRSLASRRWPHAIILHGPDGVGKELLGIRIGRILLCDAPTQYAAPAGADLDGWDQPVLDACGQCRSCHLVEVDNHPDLQVVHRRLNAHHPDAQVRQRRAVDLTVDVVRHFLIERAGSTPVMGRAKVFVVREADRMTTAAQNALLKTLEEPSASTVLILLAESPDRLLPTIRSRCQSVPLLPLPVDFVAARLVEMMPELDVDTARFYAVIGQGSLGTALRCAEDDLQSINDQLFDVLDNLDAARAVPAAKEIIELAKSHSGAWRARQPELSETDANRHALRTFFSLMLSRYRDMLFMLTGADLPIANHRHLDRMESAATAIDVTCLLDCMGAVHHAETALGRHVNVQLCVESLMIQLSRLHDRASGTAVSS